MPDDVFYNQTQSMFTPSRQLASITNPIPAVLTAIVLQKLTPYS